MRTKTADYQRGVADERARWLALATMATNVLQDAKDKSKDPQEVAGYKMAIGIVTWIVEGVVG